MNMNACAVCPRELGSPNARAVHERRAHPTWSAPPELASARRAVVVANSLASDPQRVLLNQARYRSGHRAEVSEAQRRYRATPAGRMTIKRGRQRQADAGKHSARVAVARAIERGDLVRQPCRVCRDPATDAHHHNGYERKHWLDVEWLCVTHHSDAHHPEAAEARLAIA